MLGVFSKAGEVVGPQRIMTVANLRRMVCRAEVYQEDVRRLRKRLEEVKAKAEAEAKTNGKTEAEAKEAGLTEPAIATSLDRSLVKGAELARRTAAGNTALMLALA